MRELPLIPERRRRHFPVGGGPRLDEHTCAVGRAGVARSREILAEHSRWPVRPSPARRIRRSPTRPERTTPPHPHPTDG